MVEAQHIYVMEAWAWRFRPDELGAPDLSAPYWGPPDVGIALPYGCYDLRGKVAAGTQGPVSTGKGIVVYPQTVVHPTLTYLGERNTPVSDLRKTALQTGLNLGERIVADTAGEVVAELFMQHAEPEWDLRWGRLRGDLKCLGVTWKVRDFRPEVGADWLYLQQCLQSDYDKVKRLVADGIYPPGFHLRYLQYQIEQYRIPPERYELISRNSLEAPRPHGTTWTESWPTVSTTISSGQDQPWTETISDVQVALTALVNRLTNVTGGADCYARCETDLAGDAHYGEFEFRSTTSTTTTFCGPMTRFHATETSGYIFYYNNASGAEAHLGKVTNGTPPTQTSLATADIAAPTTSVDYTERLTSTAADLHTCTLDTVDVISGHSDASFTGQINVGAFLRAAAASRGHLHAGVGADIAAGGAPVGHLVGGKLLWGGILADSRLVGR